MKQFFVPNSPVTTEEMARPTVSYISKVDKKDMNYPRTMHSHDDIVELILITSGKGAIFINEQLYHVKQGDLVVYNSKVLHDELFSEEAVSLYCIGLKGLSEENMRPNTLVSDKVKPIFQTADLYDVVLSLCQTAFSVLEHENEGYAVIVPSIVWALLKLIKDNILTKAHEIDVTSEEDKTAIVLEIKAYMDQNFAEPFQLKNIKKIKGWKINQYYFAHKFKEFYNYSPIEYLMRRRIGEAQTLLIITSYSVTEISSKVGFNSSAYFATQFKKIVGLSPKSYRKEYTERKAR